MTQISADRELSLLIWSARIIFLSWLSDQTYVSACIREICGSSILWLARKWRNMSGPEIVIIDSIRPNNFSLLIEWTDACICVNPRNLREFRFMVSQQMTQTCADQKLSLLIHSARIIFLSWLSDQKYASAWIREICGRSILWSASKWCKYAKIGNCHYWFDPPE